MNSPNQLDFLCFFQPLECMPGIGVVRIYVWSYPILRYGSVHDALFFIDMPQVIMCFSVAGFLLNNPLIFCHQFFINIVLWWSLKTILLKEIAVLLNYSRCIVTFRYSFLNETDNTSRFYCTPLDAANLFQLISEKEITFLLMDLIIQMIGAVNSASQVIEMPLKV